MANRKRFPDFDALDPFLPVASGSFGEVDLETETIEPTIVLVTQV
jgi:hypothetical protein